MVNQSFWKNKKVFVTGHTGFKGGWVTLWLSSMGALVKGFSLDAPTIPSLFNVAFIGELCAEHQIADIRNAESLSESMKHFQPDIVIHMAAQPLVRYSYDHPIETYETNVMGTVHLLDAIRQIDTVRSVICVTSDKCYSNKEWIWGYRESDPMGGYDPYSNSKGCSELVVSAYRNSYFNSNEYSKHGVAVASVRAGNVIGGGDWAPDRLIPDILQAFEQNREVVLRNPDAIRPWQHVLEPLSGYLMLAEKLYKAGPEFNGGWNFGPSSLDAKSVEFITRTLSALWGGEAVWKVEQNNHFHEAHYLKLDCSKATQILGWHPQWALEKALKNIVDWHKAWLSGKDMKNYSLKEIESYTNSKDC